MEVKRYPDPILKKKSEEVKEITPEIQALIQEMILIMQKEKGVGLAAPQIGILKKIIVIETGKDVIAFVNPKILKKSREKFADLEGCLSFPDLWVKINRPKKVIVEAMSINGEKIQLEAEWMASRVLQHEIDHLEGVLLTDRMGLKEKWKSSRKLKELKKAYGSAR